MNGTPLWGIDLGGTKIEGAVLKSAENPEVISRIRVSTEQEYGYDHILGRINKLVDLLKNDSGLKPEVIGIGTPGIIDPGTNYMKNSNTTVLNHKPFKIDLEIRLGIPLLIMNDANCLALAETQMGVVKDESPGASVVFGVILGTGVGGGVVFDGKAWNGKMGNGGEWGHNFLDDSGGPCYCGKSGCVENVISGPALQRYYQSIGGDALSMKEIYAKYKEGDDKATKCIERLLHFFALGISSVINILDPDAIVLGGGVGNIPELYTLGVQKTLHYVFNDKVDTAFLRPKLGDSAGVFGAAFLCKDYQSFLTD